MKSSAIRMVRSPYWRLRDPTLDAILSHPNANADFDVTLHHFNDREHTVMRLFPTAFGLPIEGMNRVVTIHNLQLEYVGFDGHFALSSLTTSSSSSASAASASSPSNAFTVEAFESRDIPIAHGFDLDAFVLTPSEAGRLMQDKGLELDNGIKHEDLAMALWSLHDNQFKASYKVRQVTLDIINMSDMWIDARDGTILYKEPAVYTGNTARVYTDVPPSNLDTSELTTETLPDLVSSATGAKLKGTYFETRNCCQELYCPIASNCDDMSQCSCASTGSSSSTPSGMKKCSRPMSFSMTSSAHYPLTGAINSLYNGSPPSTVYFSGPQCSGLPIATATSNGWVDTPVDGISETSESRNNDGFSESYAYYHLSKFFSHIRDVKGDNNYCLNNAGSVSSMTCNVDGSGAMPIYMNLLYPPNLNDVISRTSSSLGRSSNTPITWSLSDLQPIANAFFVRKISSGLSTIESSVYWLNNHKGMLGFFQSNNLDVGYDAGVIYHELTHAIVHDLTGGAYKSSGIDIDGQHAQPGAMNEGWSDYFSSSYRDLQGVLSADKIGQYAFSPYLRDASNTKACPSNFGNQVHNDSQFFTAALWKIRSAIKNLLGVNGVKKFDQLLLIAISEANARETMFDQAERIKNKINAESTFTNAILNTATSAFSDAGISPRCQRYIDENFIQNNPNAFAKLTTPSSVGATSIAPFPHIMKYTVPAGETSAEFSTNVIERVASVSLAMSSSLYYDLGYLSAIISYNCPIQWTANEGARPVATGCLDGSSSRVDISGNSRLYTVTGEFSTDNRRVSVKVNAKENDVIYASFVTRFGYVSPVVGWDDGQVSAFSFSAASLGPFSLVTSTWSLVCLSIIVMYMTTRFI
jgi:Fungalysin metallopeptidase (M36)